MVAVIRPLSATIKRIWFERMAEKGWTVPQWPQEYGGAGLNDEEQKILSEEMSRLNCRPPLVGFGIWMLSPSGALQIWE